MTLRCLWQNAAADGGFGKKFPKHIIFLGARPVGAISFRKTGEKEYFLGCLCVVPRYQRMGIGTNAIAYMLSLCRDLKSVSLITPADNTGNIAFYEKNGFEIYGETTDGNVKVVKLRFVR